MLRSTAALVAFIAIPLSVGFLGSMLITDQIDGWYADATTAPWNPPNWLFGPVWTVLYALMGFAAWLVWRKQHPGRNKALTFFVIQLALNGTWSPLFFGGYPILGTPALWIAFAVITALIVTLAITIRFFKPISTVATWLLVPYMAWVLYASTLNIYIAIAN